MASDGLMLGAFGDAGLTEEGLLARMAWLRDVVGPRLERFMGYYRNPTTELAGPLACAGTTRFAVRPFRQFQELGLPARITGFRRGADGGCAATGQIEVQRKEVVIENDIAWRMNTLVDFATSRLPAIVSTARDAETQKRLTPVVQSLVRGGAGMGLLQQLVLHGLIDGSAWVQMRPTDALLARLSGEKGNGADAGAVDVGQWLTFSVVEAGRVCPVPGASAGEGEGPAYVALMCGGATVPAAAAGVKGNGFLQRLRGWLGKGDVDAPDAAEFSFDLFGAGYWQRYACGALTDQGANVLGVLPLVRYENQVDPAAGMPVGPAGSAAVDTGMSDVEPLMGLQDELNTRLSDRAFRVTLTSFQMYLGRGIEDFTSRPVGPGQMWATNNPQATIESFGGDVSTPSEETHINEVRQAIDKISGVSPIAAGTLGTKLGNLTSAVALRLTLLALLARTDRKRAALTQTLSVLAERVLGILDRAGIVASGAEDRGIDVHWPTAVPESDLEELQEAQIKVAIGVPRAVVLGELGYAEEVREAEKTAGAPAVNAAVMSAERLVHEPAVAVMPESEVVNS